VLLIKFSEKFSFLLVLYIFPGYNTDGSCFRGGNVTTTDSKPAMQSISFGLPVHLLVVPSISLAIVD